MFPFVFFSIKVQLTKSLFQWKIEFIIFPHFFFMCACVLECMCFCVHVCVFDSIFFSLLNLFLDQIWIHQTSDLILLRIFFNRIVVVVGSTLMNHHVVVERATTLQPAVTACSCCIDSCIWCCHLVLVAKRPCATCQRLPKWLIIH